MKKEYISVVINIPEEKQEIALSVFMDFEFTGIEQNEDTITVTFESTNYNNALENNIITLLKEFYDQVEIVDKFIIGDKNWNEEWEKNLKEIYVNDRIGIAPTWKLDELDTEIKIEINPKMSFGTGEHASTRLVAKLMDNAVTRNSFWIDAGTGTGILAILAIMLGAKKCYAFDNNEWSIENSIENIKLNNVEEFIELEQKDIDDFDLPKCDGIAANIFLNVILNSMAKFRKALSIGGDLIISGILTYDKEQVIENAENNSLKLINLIEEQEWTGFWFKAV